MDNHYHILLSIKKGATLSAIVRYINGGSSYDLNIMDKTKGRKIWWNYWDKSIREENDYYRIMNYIHHNPVKHCYAKRMDGYKYSSYRVYLRKYGKEWLNDCFREYLIIDFTDANDDI
ncbi:MAG: transposase [Patescibacteria group bacterium]